MPAGQIWWRFGALGHPKTLENYPGSGIDVSCLKRFQSSCSLHEVHYAKQPLNLSQPAASLSSRDRLALGLLQRLLPAVCGPHDLVGLPLLHQPPGLQRFVHHGGCLCWGPPHLPVWLPDPLHAENPSTHWPLGTVSGVSFSLLWKDAAFGGLTLEADAPSPEFSSWKISLLVGWHCGAARVSLHIHLLNLSNFTLKMGVRGGTVLFIGVDVDLLDLPGGKWGI